MEEKIAIGYAVDPDVVVGTRSAFDQELAVAGGHVAGQGDRPRQAGLEEDLILTGITVCGLDPVPQAARVVVAQIVDHGCWPKPATTARAAPAVTAAPSATFDPVRIDAPPPRRCPWHDEASCYVTRDPPWLEYLKSRFLRSTYPEIAFVSPQTKSVRSGSRFPRRALGSIGPVYLDQPGRGVLNTTEGLEDTPRH